MKSDSEFHKQQPFTTKDTLQGGGKMLAKLTRWSGVVPSGRSIYTLSSNRMWKSIFKFRALPKRWVSVTAPVRAALSETLAFLNRCLAIQTPQKRGGTLALPCVFIGHRIYWSDRWSKDAEVQERMQIFRWLFLAQLMLSSAVLAQQRMPILPPVSPTSTGERLPGKFVWADLFSSDIEASSRFYERVFDWESRRIKEPPQPYAIFYTGGEPVAGLAYREAPDGGDVYGRWIHYISVDDVDAMEQAIVERGGQILLERRRYADRGDFAIARDTHGAPFGIIHASSGDPGDYQAGFGEWIWRELFTRKLLDAIRFYTELFGYETEKETRNPQIMDYLLRSQGYLRAGIGHLGSDPEVAPTWLGYVRVEDIDVTLKRVVANGGKVLFEPTQEIADGGLAIVSDPTGASIGLLQWEYEYVPDREVQP